LPIFDCSLSALRAELERNKGSSVETSIDAAFAVGSDTKAVAHES